VVHGQDQQDQSHAVSFGRLPAQPLVDSQLHHAGIHVNNPLQADAFQEAMQAVAAAVASTLPVEGRAFQQVQPATVSGKSFNIFKTNTLPYVAACTAALPTTQYCVYYKTVVCQPPFTSCSPTSASL
jgi:hypothetical protein